MLLPRDSFYSTIFSTSICFTVTKHIIVLSRTYRTVWMVPWMNYSSETMIIKKDIIFSTAAFLHILLCLRGCTGAKNICSFLLQTLHFSTFSGNFLFLTRERTNGVYKEVAWILRKMTPNDSFIHDSKSQTWLSIFNEDSIRNKDSLGNRVKEIRFSTQLIELRAGKL